MRDLGGTPKVWIIISFMRREDGVSSKDLSKDRIGRDPFRQLPDKFNSSLQLTPPFILFYVVCTMISNGGGREYNFEGAISWKGHLALSIPTCINLVHAFVTRRTTHYYSYTDPPIHSSDIISTWYRV